MTTGSGTNSLQVIMKGAAYLQIQITDFMSEVQSFSRVGEVMMKTTGPDPDITKDWGKNICYRRSIKL